ncbi:MAG: hypothetical protein ABSC19_03470 [Syntrophorhabdales bacterium]|jgi:hypothetical protein
MKKVIGMVMVVFLLVCVTAATVRTVQAQGPMVREEAVEHPNIARAIEALEAAVAEMQRAPHDFRGHKAKAIEASEKAIKQLKLALAFRARQDNRPRY